MRNITLSADERTIDLARQKARTHGTTLNALFRTWLQRYVEPEVDARTLDRVFGRLADVRPGRTFTREEMHDRR